MRVPILLVLLIPLASAYTFDSSLYDAAQVTANIEVTSSVELAGTGSGEVLQATVYYVPEESAAITTTPQASNMQPLTFTWNNVHAGEYPFSYKTTVVTHAQSPRITKKIAYPFSSPSSLTTYLQAHEITDTNRAIQAKANELARGKTDAMETVFTIATWVQQNIAYDLNSVTAQASKKSSWVYEEQYGVCDELTSLFISLSREAGIPARFVSGIAYTNLSQFDDNWGPHGWAEVWLPEVGWIPVDVTYGQVGYIDATHISIRHSADARNTAIDYTLRAQQLSMKTTELKTHTAVVDSSGTVEEPLDISVNALYDEVGSKSGNVITATVENEAPYYVATELYLATTPDTLLHEKRNQQVLLPPRSTRHITWRVTMPSFERQYSYTVPFAVVAQRAGSAGTNVHGSVNYEVYPLPPAPETSVTSVAINCRPPEVMYAGETESVTCTSPGATLCIDTCSEDEITLTFEAKEPGAYPRIVRADSDEGEGATIVTFIVEERPQPAISATMPPTVLADDIPTLQVQVQTAKLADAVVSVRGKHLEHEWTLKELEQKSFELRFPATYLVAGNNEITIAVHGLDKNGEPVDASTTVPVTMYATTWEKVELFLLHLFL